MASQKITAKNLTYDQTLPPFLAALRGQAVCEAGDGPDRILAARRRPTKKRRASEEAEDAPLVLDEEGNVVAGVTVGVDGAATMNDVDAGADADSNADAVASSIAGAAGGGEKPANKAAADSVQVAAIGAGKKRKVGKIIGGEDADEEKGEAPVRRSKPGKEEEKAEQKQPPSSSGTGKKSGAKEGKKKAKKIKLSFGDGDGD